MSKLITSNNILSVFEHKIKHKICVKSRKRDIVDARACFYMLCHELTSETIQDVGKVVNQHHSTVLHGRNNVFPYVKAYNERLYKEYLNTKMELIKPTKKSATKLLVELMKEEEELNSKIQYLRNIIDNN